MDTRRVWEREREAWEIGGRRQTTDKQRQGRKIDREREREREREGGGVNQGLISYLEQVGRRARKTVSWNSAQILDSPETVPLPHLRATSRQPTWKKVSGIGQLYSCQGSRAQHPGSGGPRRFNCVCVCVCMSFSSVKHPSSLRHESETSLFLSMVRTRHGSNCHGSLALLCLDRAAPSKPTAPQKLFRFFSFLSLVFGECPPMHGFD